MIVHLLLEGFLEEPVAAKLVGYCGHQVGNIFGRKGAHYIHTRARNFIHLTKAGNAMFVLTDFMDSGCDCPVEACRKHFLAGDERDNKLFVCRFAVNELESWLMADREAIAAFLGISPTKIPRNPDSEIDPKRKLVNLARTSHKTKVQDLIVPSKGHGGPVGPGYRLSMTEFVNKHWSPKRASRISPSLARCIRRLRELGG